MLQPAIKPCSRFKPKLFAWINYDVNRFSAFAALSTLGLNPSPFSYPSTVAVISKCPSRLQEINAQDLNSLTSFAEYRLRRQADVLREDEAQDDVLVFRRVHVVRDELRTKQLIEFHRIAEIRERFYTITPSRRFPNDLIKQMIGRKLTMLVE